MKSQTHVASNLELRVFEIRIATGRIWTWSKWTQIQIHFHEQDPDLNPDPQV